MKHFTIRRGERPPADPVPSGPIRDADKVSVVALLGNDFKGLRPRMEVCVGTRVECGAPLFTDRTHPSICFVSPVAGVVETLTYGPRRTLDALVIRVEPDSRTATAKPDASVRTAPRDTLLATGHWPAFRTRPFGLVPALDASPDEIVVNAVQAAPQSPDPAHVLEDQREAFHLGCNVLTRLTPGPVHIAQSPGTPLGSEGDRIRHASFSGTLAAGLAGTQIDRLCRGRSVWSVGYQDVAAIGHFFLTGAYRAHRVVSITGPMASPPRMLRVPLGARIADLVDEAPVQAVSGGPGAQRDALFLGRFDEQVVLRPAAAQAPRRRFGPRAVSYNAAIPSRAVERAVALDVLPIPLLRALSLRDAEAAERLGCLALVEDDLAAATRACTSGVDYGACLRDVLTELMADAA